MTIAAYRHHFHSKSVSNKFVDAFLAQNYNDATTRMTTMASTVCLMITVMLLMTVDGDEREVVNT